MPLYDYKCSNCNNEFEEYSLIESRNTIRCPLCSGATEILIRNANWLVDQTLGYYDNNLGCHIESTSHRRQIMKSRNLVDFNIRDMKHVYRQADQFAVDKKQHFDDTVRKVVTDTSEQLKTVKVSEPAVA